MNISTKQMILRMEERMSELKSAERQGDISKVKEHAAVLKEYCDLFLGVEGEVKAPSMPSSGIVQSPQINPSSPARSPERDADEGGSLLDF